ncbi:MAG: hypothetical protein LDLANPLL_02092 [Turneriella sp.]|nr:hypothetical protein [Turneriella sp.]
MNALTRWEFKSHLVYVFKFKRLVFSAFFRFFLASFFSPFVATCLFAGDSSAVQDTEKYSAETYMDNAQYHFSRRRFLNALDNVRIVLEILDSQKTPDKKLKLEAEILAAQTLKILEREEEAANMYERALSHGYLDKEAYAYLALYFDKNKTFDKALHYFTQYYEADKKDVATHIRYAALLGRLKKREEAKRVLAGIDVERGVKKITDCENLETKKKYKEAVECFELVRKTMPDSERNYLGIYRVATNLKDNKRVEQNAEWLYFIFGDDTRYIWPLVEVRIRQRKFYSARIFLEEIIQLRGQDSEAERLLSNLRTETGSATEKPFRASKKEMQFLEKIR